ncbi:MAG TPA: hypothetical protein VKV05_12930 [Terriglobales bacterium]|nr:hypothetical protein [Terriglobales bacterium]
MRFHSVLFPDASLRSPEEKLSPPPFFGDLNLDQVVAAITAGKQEYRLAPFFYEPLRDLDAVEFRQEVMRDLEDRPLLDNIRMFARNMALVRQHLARQQAAYYQRQKERWFLDALELYGDTVERLAEDLSRAKSRGIGAFRDYVTQYTSSQRFTLLIAEARRLKAELLAIRYTILIRGARVEVGCYRGEADYGAELETAFARFRQDSVQEYTFRSGGAPEMNHVEARILDGVANLHPDTFSKLERFVAANTDFQDAVIVAFDREIQFYVAYLEYIARLKEAGLNFCYPIVSASHQEVYDYQGFDLALAGSLLEEQLVPVCNDFHLKDPERIIVVSGPNQGGKTTFARTFGQLHYLASLGLPVPGTRARLVLCDRLFTHFERTEQMTNLRGKLEDDLVRIRDILEAATPRSIIVINEIFASTALRDAVVLSKKIASAIMKLGSLCVWVTFIDELASLDAATISMVSTVAPHDPTRRTFKIIRQAANGLAYALSLAEKYRLTYSTLRERIPDEGSSPVPPPGF